MSWKYCSIKIYTNRLRTCTFTARMPMILQCFPDNIDSILSVHSSESIQQLLHITFYRLKTQDLYEWVFCRETIALFFNLVKCFLRLFWGLPAKIDWFKTNSLPQNYPARLWLDSDEFWEEELSCPWPISRPVNSSPFQVTLDPKFWLNWFY